MSDLRTLDDLSLRRLQLAEIRAMLHLPPEATHEMVLATLVKIAEAAGAAHRQIDLLAVPPRYRNAPWNLRGAKGTPTP